MSTLFPVERNEKLNWQSCDFYPFQEVLELIRHFVFLNFDNFSLFIIGFKREIDGRVHILLNVLVEEPPLPVSS